jgi:hypothetical protein
MGSESNVINALGDAAQTLAQEIAFCRMSAERCLNTAWHATRPEQAEMAGNLLSQGENFMRLSAELADALAKLKGDANTHRQHISVERFEHPAPPPAQSAARTEPDEYDPEHAAAERARAELALAQLNAELQAGGRGEGPIPENESL